MIGCLKCEALSVPQSDINLKYTGKIFSRVNLYYARSSVRCSDINIGQYIRAAKVVMDVGLKV